MFPRCPYCLTEPEIIAKSEDRAIEESWTSKSTNENKLDCTKGTYEILDEFTKIQSESRLKDMPIRDISYLGSRSKNILMQNGILYISQLKDFIKTNKLSDLIDIGKDSEVEIISSLILMKSSEELNCIVKEESHRQTSNEEIKITEAFSENTFNLFVDYCRKNNLHYISELKDFDFSIINKVPGIGRGKIEKIITRYKEVITCTKTDFMKKYNDVVEVMFDEIDESILCLDLECLYALGVSLNTLNILKKNGYLFIRDIMSISKKQLIEIVGTRNIEKFENIQVLLKKNIFELFENVLDSLKDGEEYKFFIRRASGYTLQEIADEIGITRERVRQIVKKFNVKIMNFVELIIEREMLRKGYVTVQELQDIYNSDDFDNILVYSCVQNEKLEYLDFADVFVNKRKDGRLTEDIIYNIAVDFIGEGKDLYKNLEELETLMRDQGFPYIEIGEFINLIQKYGYRLYGDYAVKGKQSYGYLCARLIAREFPKGIKLYNSEELDKLRDLVKNEYGDLGLPESNRALSARLSSYLVLSDRGAVIAEENIQVATSTINEIKDYIDNSEETTIYFSELFSKFEGILRMTSNIDNYNFLHGVLMLFYPYEYNYSKDYLVKKTGDGVSRSLNERIKDLIIKQNRPVHKDEVKGFTDAMILRALAEDKDLLQWDYNNYSCIQILKINNEIKNTLKDSLQNILDENNGYCSDRMLYENVNDILSDFINVNNITSSINLFYICACLFSEQFDFKRPHVIRKGMIDDVSTKNIALHLIGDTEEISYQKYNKIAEEFKWSAVTAGIVFSEIENDYVRVSDDLYIRKDCFILSNDQLCKIEDKLSRHMKYNILPLINFNSWDELPEISYDWNAFLLNSIICRYGCSLKVIEPRMKDRRYQRGIVVYKDSGLMKYPEVVAYVLKQYGLDEVSESKLLSFLIINGLAHKTIPKELYNAECINYINGKFIVN